MIYGKIREKMQEKLKHFLFGFDPNNNSIVYVYDEYFTLIKPGVTKPLFSFNADSNTFEFRERTYSEEEFFRVLDLLIFT